jgi:hypothetical protein
MQKLKHEILNYARQLPEGAPLMAKGLLHLGNRAAVDQALLRLAKQEILIRGMRGLYFLPVNTKYGTASPSVEKVISGLASGLCETIVPSGAAAANSLGLSTQIPTRHVYLTSGRSRKFNLGNQVIELQHAEPWQLFPGREGQAIRALAWLGQEDIAMAIQKLKSMLSPVEFGNIAIALSNFPARLGHSVRSALNG